MPLRPGARRAVAAMLSEGGPSIVFQPIVEIGTGHVRSLEALARFPGGGSPGYWFAAAARAGVSHDLELDCIAKALSAARRLSAGVGVSVNASPSLLCEPELRRLVASAERRVTVEVTELEALPDGWQRAIASLRAAGAQIAVDDLGAGHSDATRVVELAPDQVKLDLAVTRRLLTDAPAARRQVEAALVAAARCGADVVAEGVEIEGQRSVLVELGVRLAQGFLFAPPQPPGRGRFRRSFGVAPA